MRATTRLKFVAALHALIGAAPAFAQNLKQGLESRYRLTSISAEGELVTQGAALALRVGGLVAGPSAHCNSDFKDGKFSLGRVGKATCNTVAKVPGAGLIPGVIKVTGGAQEPRTFVAGEKMYDTKITVKDDGIVFDLASDFIPDIRYLAEVKFPFKKGSPPDLAEAEKMIDQAFQISGGASLQTSRAAPAPVFTPIPPPPPPPDQALPATPAVARTVPDPGTPVPAPVAVPPLTPASVPLDQPEAAPASARRLGISTPVLLGAGGGLALLLAVGAFLAMKPRTHIATIPPPPPPPAWAPAPPPAWIAAPEPAVQAEAESGLPWPIAPPAPVAAVPSNRLDELKVLLDLGILTEAEFEAERAKLDAAPVAQTKLWEPAPAEAAPALLAPTVAGPRTLSIGLGQPEHHVVDMLGQPTTVADLGTKRILVYPNLKITFRDGVVADVD